MSDYLRNMINNQSITPPATLIKGATLLSMDDRVGNLERGDILIEAQRSSPLVKIWQQKAPA